MGGGGGGGVGVEKYLPEPEPALGGPETDSILSTNYGQWRSCWYAIGQFETSEIYIMIIKFLPLKLWQWRKQFFHLTWTVLRYHGRVIV